MSSLLEALEERAGASDQNREEWLAERRAGITATEAKRLALGEVPDALVLEKVLGDSFTGNRYTAWGKEREPVIAELFSRAHPYLVEEHRVFHAAENPRHLASPDMMGQVRDQLILAEIKTSGKNLSDPQIFEKTGYAWQMQWQMYVTGASSCWLVHETHHGDWAHRPDGSEAPQTVDPIRSWRVIRDDQMIEHMKALADETLAMLDEVNAA